MIVLAYILIFGLLGAFAVSTVLALAWAIRDGQFADVQRGASSIFDEDEPPGRRTDGFPDEVAKSHDHSPTAR